MAHHHDPIPRLGLDLPAEAGVESACRRHIPMCSKAQQPQVGSRGEIVGVRHQSSANALSLRFGGNCDIPYVQRIVYRLSNHYTYRGAILLGDHHQAGRDVRIDTRTYIGEIVEAITPFCIGGPEQMGSRCGIIGICGAKDHAPIVPIRNPCRQPQFEID